MEEYLKTLLEQIRCKKAHASIYHEIRGQGGTSKNRWQTI